MRRGAGEYFPLLERLSHQSEVVVFEVAQSAMDQLAAPGRGCRCQVGLFAEQHTQAAARGIARDTNAIYAATNY